MPCQTYEVRRCQRLPELLCTPPIPRDYPLTIKIHAGLAVAKNPQESTRRPPTPSAAS
jgi:hypothetical protein